MCYLLGLESPAVPVTVSCQPDTLRKMTSEELEELRNARGMSSQRPFPFGLPVHNQVSLLNGQGRVTEESSRPCLSSRCAH